MELEFKNIEVPKELDEVVEQSMQKLKEENKCRKRKNWIVKTMGAVACAGIVVFGAVNPSFAAKVPLVGHIFESMQLHFSYRGDYSGIGKVLTNDEENASEVTDGKERKTADQGSYTKTVDGVTVTLSEIYCNQQAIYLSMEIQSDEVIPDIYNPQLFTTEEYSFNSSPLSDCPVLNGQRIDDHTYAGLIRLDLNEKNIDTSEMEETKGTDDKNLMQVVKIPNEFSLSISINQIRGSLKNPPKADLGITQEEIEKMSQKEWKDFMQKWDKEHPDWEDACDAIYKGPWEFTLDVAMNQDDTQVINLENRAENGLGFSAVVKDRFEITAYGLNNMPEDMGDYFPVFLDADGRLMDYGDGGSVNTVAINNSDISTVYLYLVDNDLWLNSLKSKWWKTADGLTEDGDIQAFNQLLQEKCAYYTTVHFK